MKRIVKKNQIVLTVLAVMIAVAGYLTYAGNDGLLPVGTQGETQTGPSDQEVMEENAALGNGAAQENQGTVQEEEAPMPDGTPGE